ncbi:hypothetical protein NCCP2050_12070 [Planococcus sp. NCCP-2050]|nr:hypothetical protein NCCP2050_12070 [Planococcus sp. NCCP-2050]
MPPLGLASLVFSDSWVSCSGATGSVTSSESPHAAKTMAEDSIKAVNKGFLVEIMKVILSIVIRYNYVFPVFSFLIVILE